MRIALFVAYTITLLVAGICIGHVFGGAIQTATAPAVPAPVPTATPPTSIDRAPLPSTTTRRHHD